MTKIEFLNKLRMRLSALPNEEIEERIAFYSEVIDDRIEEGMSEEDAVASVGANDEISIDAKPEPKQKNQKRSFSVLAVVLIILGFPLWFPLLIAAFAVVLSVFAAVLSVIISLWAVFASFVGCAIGGVVGGTVIAFSTSPFVGTALIGAGLVCAGLAIFGFFVCYAVTKGAVLCTKLIFTKRGRK